MTVDGAWVDPSAGGTLDLTAGGKITEEAVDAYASNFLHLGGANGVLSTLDTGQVRLTNSGVAHGMTDLVPTDVSATIDQVAAGDGGIRLAGYNEGAIGAQLYGYVTTDNTTHNATGVGAVYINAAKKSGTTAGAMGANANLLCVANNGSVRMIVDAEGDTFQDGTGGTAYDAYDDVALLNAMQGAMVGLSDPIRQQFAAYLDEHRDVLVQTGLLAINEDGNHWVNMSGLTRLLVGAVRQLGRQKQTLEDRLAMMDARLALAEQRLAALPEG